MKKTSRFFIALIIAFIAILIPLLPTFFSKENSRISTNKTFQLQKILDKNQSVELIFFGYTGCVDICSPRLDSLGKWYNSLSKSNQKKINVRFMDISQPRDDDWPYRFARAFHKDFIGIYLDEKQLRDYTKPFLVYFSPSLSRDDEMDHTAHLYAVKRDRDNSKAIRYIYNSYPYNFDQILKDIEGLVNE